MPVTRKGGNIVVPDLTKLAVPVGLKLAEQHFQRLVKQTKQGGSANLKRKGGNTLEKLIVPFGLLTTGEYVSQNKLVTENPVTKMVDATLGKKSASSPKKPSVKRGGNVLEQLAVPFGLDMLKDKVVKKSKKGGSSCGSATMHEGGASKKRGASGKKKCKCTKK